MDRKFNILLVEDDAKACAAMKCAVEEYDDLNLVAVTNNSTEALELTKYYLPDLVILDLELHEGGGNGFLYLKGLSTLNLTPMPYILITTNNPSTVTHKIAKDLGADFTLTKTENDYSPEYVADMIHIMKDSVISARKGAEKGSDSTDSPETTDKRLRNRIQRELELIGINPKHGGHNYLIDAIALVYNKPEPNIPTILAKQYKKTSFSIERAMQNAINYAWGHTPIDDLMLYFTAKIASDKGVPTVTEFVYYYANKIKSDL